MQNNLSGHQSDQYHTRFTSTSSGEVKAENMPAKDSNRTDRMIPTTSKVKEVAVADKAPSPTDPSSPGFLQIPPSLSFTSPTPETSPFRTSTSASASPSESKNSTALQIPPPVKTPSRPPSDKSKGKRKADDVETTPPDQKKDSQRATFAPVDPRREHLNHFPVFNFKKD